MYEHVGNPLSSEASECTRLRFYTWARPVVCQQRKSGHRGLQPRRAYLQVQGQRPTCIFPVAGCVAKRLNKKKKYIPLSDGTATRFFNAPKYAEGRPSGQVGRFRNNLAPLPNSVVACTSQSTCTPGNRRLSFLLPCHC